jgi:hypothetical protein
MSTRKQDEALSEYLTGEEIATLDGNNLVINVDAQDVFDWVGDHSAPEEVFSDRRLAEWAETHGWIKE